MSKRICERCKSENVIEDTYYGGKQYYLCESCLCRGDKEAFPKKTLFHHITQSPEMLAEKLVYCEKDESFCSCASWRSVILGDISYARKTEAIAATVAKLKEVVE